jgi:hypothetical protein
MGDITTVLAIYPLVNMKKIMEKPFLTGKLTINGNVQ